MRIILVIFLLAVAQTSVSQTAQSQTAQSRTAQSQTQESTSTRTQEDLDKKLENLGKELPAEPANNKTGIKGSLDLKDIVRKVEKEAKRPGVDPTKLPNLEDLKSDDVGRILPALEKASNVPGLENLNEMPNFAAIKSGNMGQMVPEFQKLAAIKGLEGLRNLPNIATLQSGNVEQILPEIQKLAQIKGLEGLASLPNVDAIKSGDLSKMLPEVEKLATLPGLEKLNSTAGLKEITKVLPQVLKSSKELKFHFEVANHEGWNFGVDVGVQTAWDLQRLTTGIDTGQYLELGGKVVVYESLLLGHHEWRNRFYLHEAFTKTPNIDAFIKSHDHLGLKTEYLWKPWFWFGLFAEASMDTPIFPGQDVQPFVVTYRIFDPSGADTHQNVTDDHITLSGYFAPLLVAQAGGAFMRPFKQKEIWWEIKAGAFAYQTFADGAQRVMNPLSGGFVDIRQLQTSYQFGPSLGTDIYGVLFDNFFSYTLSARAGYSAVDTSYANQIGIGGAFNLRSSASLTFNPFSWIGVTVDTRVTYLPNIVADLQIANRVYLNFPFSV